MWRACLARIPFWRNTPFSVHPFSTPARALFCQQGLSLNRCIASLCLQKAHMMSKKCWAPLNAVVCTDRETKLGSCKGTGSGWTKLKYLQGRCHLIWDPCKLQIALLPCRFRLSVLPAAAEFQVRINFMITVIVLLIEEIGIVRELESKCTLEAFCSALWQSPCHGVLIWVRALQTDQVSHVPWLLWPFCGCQEIPWLVPPFSPSSTWTARLQAYNTEVKVYQLPEGSLGQTEIRDSQNSVLFRRR